MIKMNKKGDISINTIVVAALSITVLIIMIFIFRNQIGNISGGFTTIGSDAKQNINGTKCESILGDKVCGEDKSNYDNKYDLVLLPKPNGGKWTDCTVQECYEIRSR